MIIVELFKGNGGTGTEVNPMLPHDPLFDE